MKKLLAAGLFVLFFASLSQAAYRLYLKNGSTISGIVSYRKEDGEIKFNAGGGTIGIPESEIVRIEEYTPGAEEKLKEEHVPAPFRPKAPPASPQSPAPPAVSPRAGQIKARLAEIDQELAGIRKAEDKYKALQDELYQVNLRIQVLFKKGIDAAMAAGKSQLEANQTYLQYLTPEEQQMVQANFIHKGELETELKDKKAEFDQLMTKKENLLRRKQDLEEELKGLQTGQAF